MTEKLKFKIQILNLKVWQEVIGVYRGISPEKNPILRIKGEDFEINAFNHQSNEQLKKQLNDLRLGDLVGIIRTDSIDQPFFVRIVKPKNRKVTCGGT
jgi:hypothetical protein